jgi:ribonucleoside-diphosphate reductase subunit M1
MAADRGAFIDQSQSLNIHMKEPTMGKITSMHFTGWKLGLKTGMYYLRTMAASAPIQFTVDQEALKVADTNVARAVGAKKRTTGAYSSVSSPKPLAAAQKAPETAVPEDLVTPAATPPPKPERQARKLGRTASAVVNPPFKADQEEGDSPEVLAADGTNAVPHGDALPEPAVKKGSKQEEDAEEASKDREGDIYAEAVLACSIENPESCVMCSG